MGRPTVLLLHHPLHSVHIRVVTYLAQFLEQHCNVDVLLDIRDIPQTEQKVRIIFFAYCLTVHCNYWIVTKKICKIEQNKIEDRTGVQFGEVMQTFLYATESSARFLGF
jgi:GTP-binding protein EngB required for normal cell division